MTSYWVTTFFATGIENIVGGGGDNIFTFHGNARLRGVISSEGDITLNYQDYDNNADASDAVTGVTVDGTAGIAYTLWDAVEVPVWGEIAESKVLFGSATSVLGERWNSLSGLINAAVAADSQFNLSNNAVAGFTRVIGSSGDDTFVGNDNDNIFVIGQGGLDTIDGGESDENGNTLSLEGQTDNYSVDFSLGTVSREQGDEQQSVMLNAVQGDQFTLELPASTHSAIGGFTTADITVGATDTATAANIKTALELFSGVNVSVVPDGTTAGLFTITFLNLDRFDNPEQLIFTPTHLTPASTIAIQNAVAALPAPDGSEQNYIHQITLGNQISGGEFAFTFDHPDGTTGQVTVDITAAADYQEMMQLIEDKLNDLAGLTVDVTQPDPASAEDQRNFTFNIEFIAPAYTGVTGISLDTGNLERGSEVTTVLDGSVIIASYKNIQNVEGGNGNDVFRNVNRDIVVTDLVDRTTNPTDPASFDLDLTAASLQQDELITLSFANFEETAGVAPDPARLAATFAIGADNAATVANIEAALNELTGIVVSVSSAVDGQFTILFSTSPAPVVNDFKVDSASTVFTFNPQFGQDKVFSSGASDVLDFSAIADEVKQAPPQTDADGEYTSYSYTDSAGTYHEVKAYGTFEVKGLAAVSDSEGLWTAFKSSQGYGDIVTTTAATGTGETLDAATDAAAIEALKNEAIARWTEVLPAAALTNLQNITITVGDIGDNVVGRTTSVAGANGLEYTITLDDNAAGATWYVDATAADDSDDGAYDGIDLLTVLMHEMGHVMGMSHPDFATTDLMMEEIGKGQRLLPTSDHFKSLSDQTKLSIGLGELANWSSHLGTKIDSYLDDSTAIPFTDLSLSDLLGDKVTNLDSTIQAKVQAFVDAIDGYLELNNSATTKDLLEHLQTTGANDGYAINVASSSNLKEYSVSLSLESFSELVNLDLNELISFGDFNFDLPIDITQSQPLVLSGGIDFMFNFGVDDDGAFYVRDPGLDAHFNFGEEYIDITGITAGSSDTTPATITVAGNHIGAIKGTSAGMFMVGDSFYLQGSGNTDELYTVAAIELSPDGNSTIITVAEEISASDLPDVLAGNLIKAFDFGVNLGPVGFEVNDAALSLGASVGMGFDGVLNYQDMLSDSTASLMGSPGLEGDAHYEVLLPVSLSGALDGFSDDVGFITASSSSLPDNASLGQFFASIPASVQFDNLEDVFSLGGLSLDMIIGGVDELLQDIVGTDREVLGQEVGDVVNFYEQRWGAGAVLPTDSYEIAPVGGPQASRYEILEDGKGIILYEWQDTATNDTYWGVELFKDNVRVVQTYAHTSWELMGSYDASDVLIESVTENEITGATFIDTTGANPATTGQSLSRFNIKDGILYDKIALIDASLADILGDGGVSLAAGLSNAVSTVRDAARNVQQLEDMLNEELRILLAPLGIAPDADLVDMSYLNSSFDFDLNLDLIAEKEFDLALDIDALGLDTWLGLPDGALDAINVEANAKIDLRAEAGLDLGFGFDLSDVRIPIFYIDEATGIHASLHGGVDDLDIELGFDAGPLGTIGLLGKHGSANIDLGFYANMGNPGADANGNGYLDLTEVRDGFQASAYGAAGLNLPMFFPIEALPLGGTDKDLDADGVGDNVLSAKAAFSVDQSQNFVSTFDYNLPKFNMNFDVIVLLLDLLNDPKTVREGLEGAFSAINEVANGIDNIELPLVGGEPFDDLANSLRSLETSVLGEKDASGYINGLGKKLQDLEAVGGKVFEALLNEIRQGLYDGLKTINSPLFSFVVPLLDASGAVQYDENGKIKTRLPTSADDIELTFSANGLLSFDIKFGGVLVDGELPVDFAVGMPGLGLDVDASLIAEIDYLMGLGIGLGNMAPLGSGPDFGLFLNTSGINAKGEEIALDVDARLKNGSTAQGTLGFLKVDVTDETGGKVLQYDGAGNVINDKGAGISGHFGFDIKDIGGKTGTVAADGRLELGEKIELAINANAYAEAKLFTKVSTSAADVLPSIDTTIIYYQDLASGTLSTKSGASISFGDPNITLQNVRLDAGSVFESFLGDTFDTIGNIILPLKPVIDLLNTDIDMGVAKLKILDIAYLRLPATTVDTAKKVIAALAATIDFLEKAQTLKSAGYIDFGDFNLTGGYATDTSAPVTSKNTAGAKSEADRNAQLGSHASTIAGPSQDGVEGGKSSANKPTNNRATFGNPQGQKNFRIPILEDPASLLQFITGRGEVDLFWYDLPDLDLFFEYQKTFPVYPGFNVGFFGEIGASTNFDFGLIPVVSVNG